MKPTHMALLAALLSTACAPGAPEENGERADDDESAIASEKFAVDISLWSGEITDSEVRCFWDNGVSHVVVGTQTPRISRQQLDAAIHGGMTVDLYVYLYWNTSMTAQVEKARALAAEYPTTVKRLWLDVEEPPNGVGATGLKLKVHEALDACGELECGIYTGKGFWQTYMADTHEFASVPLWYAWYDKNPSTSTWATQKFGGWAAPTAKQWEETYYCGIDVDKNTMLVDAEPTETPTPFAPDGPGVPKAPVGMYPDNLERIETSTVRMLVDTVQTGVSKYAFEVQSWNGAHWVAYYTFTSGKNGFRFSPVYPKTAYRFRARAQDGSGWGEWSHWGEWTMGTASKVPPASALDPQDGAEPAPSDPPAPPAPPDPAGAPTGLSPADGATVTTSAVTLSCGAVAGATQYVFEIEHKDPATSTWKAYYSYTGATPTRTFYPQFAHRDYRFRVRALSGGAWTPSSAFALFHYN